MTYRVLAELLIEAGRLGEAEEILDLLKEQELRDIVRSATPDGAAKIESLNLTAAQRKAQSDMADLEKKALALSNSVLRRQACRSKRRAPPRRTLD